METKKDKSHGEQAFNTELETKARVEHHSIDNHPVMEQLREVLADMGRDLQDTGIAPKELEYMGSFSVHVYAAQGLKGNYAFVGVTNSGKCFFKLAEAAGRKLMGDIQMMYRGRMQKKRSGFASG